MSYVVPPSRTPNGRRAGCLCILGALSGIGGSLAAGTLFTEVRGVRTSLIGMQHSGQLTGGLSLFIILLSGILFVTNWRLTRWIIGGTAFILGMLFVPSAVAHFPEPLVWMPILGSLVILIASLWTITPARKSWWHDAPQSSPIQVQTLLPSSTRSKIQLNGLLCAIGSIMSLLASIRALMNRGWWGPGLGPDHNGLITGILSFGILLLSIRHLVATKNEHSLRMPIISLTILMSLCFIPATLDKLPIAGPGYAMIGAFIILIAVNSDIAIHR